MTLAILSGVLIFLSPSGRADGEMTFRGTLIAPPPCKVDGSQPIEVYFGDRLSINKVNGIEYAKPLNYTLDCKDSSELGWKLVLSIYGSPSPFDNDVFKTTSLEINKDNEDNLGIRIYQENGATIRPNEQIEILDSQNPPRLMAVPIKRAGSILVEGNFETLITLLAHYQ